MNGYQLIASLVQSLVSLAWPVAFVVAIGLFRERLTQLLPHLRVKHKETEVSFRLQQAEQELKRIEAPTPTSVLPPPTPEEKTRFEQIAEVSPRAAILEKRADLEQTIKQAAEPYFLKMNLNSSGKSRSLLQAIRLLRQEGIIDDKTSALLDDLRVIGNRAAHEPEEPAINSKTNALRFGQLVDHILRYVQVFT